MSQPVAVAHKITRPIQIVAIFMVGMVVLVGAFLAGAAAVSNPTWASAMLAITAVLIVPAFLGTSAVLLTRFRDYLQEDAYFSEWRRRQEQVFRGFSPENLEASSSGDQTVDGVDLEHRRIEAYERNYGLFLVHSWRPSSQPAQIADIVIRLTQHGDGPLSEGRVTKVEYELGRKFFQAPLVKSSAADMFRIEVSAYGPMLCIARVHFSDQREPILLARYIDFDVAE